MVNASFIAKGYRATFKPVPISPPLSRALGATTPLKGNVVNLRKITTVFDFGGTFGICA